MVESIIKQSDVFELVGYCLPENEKEVYPEIIELLKGYDELTLDEVLNNPKVEAVIIQTEEIYTSKYVKLAAAHNKHVHMEKAGGIDRGEFTEAVLAVKRSGKVFHIGYMYRYNPCIIKLLQDIQAGELGDIISVEAQMNCTLNVDFRSWLSRLPGGMMYYLGCHLVDLVLKIQGKPLSVLPLSRSTGYDGIDSQDFGMTVFTYEKGVSLVKTSAMERGGFLRRQLVVTGTKKTVELKPLEQYLEGGAELFTGVTEYDSLDWHRPGSHFHSASFNRYDAMMKSFAEMVSGEKENPNTYDYEIMLHDYILKACGENI